MINFTNSIVPWGPIFSPHPKSIDFWNINEFFKIKNWVWKVDNCFKNHIELKNSLVNFFTVTENIDISYPINNPKKDKTIAIILPSMGRIILVGLLNIIHLNMDPDKIE